MYLNIALYQTTILSTIDLLLVLLAFLSYYVTDIVNNICIANFIYDKFSVSKSISAFSIDLANTKAGKKAILQLNGTTDTHIDYFFVSHNIATQKKQQVSITRYLDKRVYQTPFEQ